jgi:hypothetical protein
VAAAARQISGQRVPGSRQRAAGMPSPSESR